MFSRPSADQGFDEFTAALAHRVIALWFLHCKVQLRMSLAKYIRFSLSRPIADITNEEASRDFRDRSQSMGHQARRYDNVCACSCLFGFVVSCPCRRTDLLTSLPFVSVLLVHTLPLSC